MSGGAKKIADNKREKCKNNYFSIVTPRKKMYFIQSDYDKNKNIPRMKVLFADDYLTVHPGDFWQDIKTTGLDNEGGVDFKSGKKPIALIERIIKSIDNPNSIILDFFAGSGTTGEVVLKINHEEKTNRKFILCNNNELNGYEEILKKQGKKDKEIKEFGIARNVLLPRINRAIKKYNGGSLKYFKTAFVKNTISRDEMKTKLTRQCTEMLCLREGIFNKVKELDNYRIFSQGGKTMAAYYSLERNDLKKLKKDLDKIKGKKILYCFTLDQIGLNKNEFIGWDNVRLEPIPQKILDVYKNIYEY